MKELLPVTLCTNLGKRWNILQFSSVLSNIIKRDMVSRGVFRTRSYIDDGAFCEKNSLVNISLGSEYASDKFLYVVFLIHK